MKQGVLVAGLMAAIGLTGCGGAGSEVQRDLATSQQQVKDLTARVDTLEAKVQALEAALPVDASPDTDQSDGNAS